METRLFKRLFLINLIFINAFGQNSPDFQRPSFLDKFDEALVKDN